MHKGISFYYFFWLHLSIESLGDKHSKRFWQEMKNIDWGYQSFLEEKIIGDDVWPF